jgi:glutamine phosphoribosylpyrophosphate amidotransferase
MKRSKLINTVLNLDPLMYTTTTELTELAGKSKDELIDDIITSAYLYKDGLEKYVAEKNPTLFDGKL